MFRGFYLILFSLWIATSALYGQPAAMQYIAGGKFVPLYSTDESAQEVAPFFIDSYPVTNAQFKAFVKTHPEWAKANVKQLFADGKYLNHWKSNTDFDTVLENSPVVFVSWFAAEKYCESEGKRLPNTAEWELVAAAGSRGPDGQKEEGFNEWILDMASKPKAETMPEVGSTRKNFYGVWDMHGLVWEWTYDFNTALTTGESRGNSSLDNNLFCGGGSFASKDLNNYASFLRFALRSSLKAKYTVGNVGFRCVKEAPPKTKNQK